MYQCIEEYESKDMRVMTEMLLLEVWTSHDGTCPRDSRLILKLNMYQWLVVIKFSFYLASCIYADRRCTHVSIPA